MKIYVDALPESGLACPFKKPVPTRKGMVLYCNLNGGKCPEPSACTSLKVLTVTGNSISTSGSDGSVTYTPPVG